MKSLRLLFVFFIVLSVSVLVTHATCVPSDTGTAGNDTIDCDLANQPVVDVAGLDGDDTITIGAGVTTGNDIYGGNVGILPESGNDTIVIDGTVGDVFGDSNGGVGTGNDTIINNGTANEIYGDTSFADGSGSDVITNNGSMSVISGDSNSNNGSGNDVITNNGSTAVMIGDTTGGVGTGNDIIINNGVTSSGIYGDSVNGFSGGSDIIINNGSTDMMTGDGATALGSSADSITNNGGANYIVGDSAYAVGTGSDVIVNNGSAIEIYGDSFGDDGSGNDFITNNGTTNAMAGDNYNGIGSGNDTLVNNGSVSFDIYGDSTVGISTGSDTITNNGNVGGNIIAGGGNDTVIIQGNVSTVGGTIDGGTEYDVLTFSLQSASTTQLDAWAAEIAAANPAGGTITLNGHTYTWTSFEELRSLLTLTSIPATGSLRPFCALGGGVDIYVSVGDEGVFSLYVSAGAISNALSYAQVNNIEVTIDASDTSQLWALPSGELQVREADGAIILTFLYQSYCGELPEGDEEAYVIEVPPQEEELPPFSIINQPYGG